MIKQIKRPGITTETLQQANIRFVNESEAMSLCSIAESGIWIPFHDVQSRPIMDNEKPYGRLRLDVPKSGKKYHQKTGTEQHIYIPHLLKDLSVVKLVIVEGEFKALSLCEAGIAAIGISGFYGSMQRDLESEQWYINEELQEILKFDELEFVSFLGDSDTTFNLQFADAAIKLCNLLGAPLELPRIPLHLSKGIDDIRENDTENFHKIYRTIEKRGITLYPDETISSYELLLRLLEIEKEYICKQIFGGLSTGEFVKRMTGIISSTPVHIKSSMEDVLLNWAKILGKRELNAAIKEYKQDSKKSRIAYKFEIDLPEVCKNIFFVSDIYYVIESNEILKLNATALQTYLATHRGVTAKPYPEEMNREGSPFHDAILYIQSHSSSIKAVLPSLCGRQMGLITEGTHNLLIQQGNRFIESNRRFINHSPLFNYFHELLGHDEIQFKTFIGWLKIARMAIRSPKSHLPGQLLALVGEAGCGKTLAQTLITQCLGGRETNPANYLQGLTPFNSQMWESEHLAVSDANVEHDGKGKQKFRNNVKELVANYLYPLAKKHCPEMTLRPIWRITISVNTDVDSAAILPNPFMNDIQDKLIYLYCNRPVSGFGGFNRDEWFSNMIQDLPNFLAYVDNFEIPSELHGERFGVREYISPEVVEILNSSNSDGAFIELIQEWMIKNQKEWRGTVKTLFNDLCQFSASTHTLVRDTRILGHTMRRIMSLPMFKGVISLEKVKNGSNCYLNHYVFKKTDVEPPVNVRRIAPFLRN